MKALAPQISCPAANYSARPRAVHLPRKFPLSGITVATGITTGTNRELLAPRYAMPCAMRAVQAIVIAPIKDTGAHLEGREKRGEECINRAGESRTFRGQIPASVKLYKRNERYIKSTAGIMQVHSSPS